MTRISWRSVCCSLLFAIITGTPGFAAGALRIPRKDLLARVHVIGILPAINGVNDTPVPEGIDDQVARALRAGGFQVIEARDYLDTELAVRKTRGGWFDPFTGRWDRNKHDAMLNEAMQVYVARYQPDGLLRARVIERPMLYSDLKRVEWDGVVENVVASESLMAAWNRSVGVVNNRGEFSVLSLRVALYDLQGTELFAGQGGMGARTVLVKKQFVPVDLPDLLTDVPRITQAVAIATSELIGATHKEGAPAGVVAIGKLATPVSPPAPEALVTAQRASIQKTVKTIAILPTDLYETGGEDSIQEIYHDQLSQDLKAAGYAVVSRWTTNQISKEAAEQVGGIFDPVSGAVLEERRTRAREIQIQQLRDQQHVDALMTVAFPKTRLPFNQKGTVQWDGVSRSAIVSGSKLDRFATYEGTVDGLSVAVRLTALDGTVLYSRRAGIDLLAHYTGSVFLEQSWSQILKDPGQSIAPVKSVLSGLTDD